MQRNKALAPAACRPTMTQPLAQRLRDETRPLHTRSERAGLMPALLRGTLPRPAYAALLRHLLALYEPLEAALARHAGHPWLAGWPLDALCRRAALADDLALLTVPVTDASAAGGAAPAPLVPALQAMRARITELAGAPVPGLLLAHAYVRYLGDLSGGQIVARQVRAAYGLAPGEGTRFYDFGPPEAAAALLARCRQALAETCPSPTDSDALVAEACWSFERHAELFEQLTTDAPANGPPAAG